MVGIRLRDATGTLRTVARIRVRDATNTLRTIQRIRIRDATNTLRTVYQYMNASASPNTASGSGSGAASSGLVTTTGTTTATPSGGTAPYTYAWTRVSGDITISINSPSAATTSFTASVADGVPKEAAFKCTITDANGTIVETNEVSVYLEWFDTR